MPKRGTLAWLIRLLQQLQVAGTASEAKVYINDPTFGRVEVGGALYGIADVELTPNDDDEEAAQQQAEPGSDERAAWGQDNDNGLMSRVPESIAQVINEEDVPIGYAGAMPYCDDWTQAVFEADKVPEGTPLYLKTAQSGQRAGVAEGWQLVPVEPTEEMLRAADEGDREYSVRNFGDGVVVRQGPYDHWVAMLGAAPTQQQEGGS